METTCDCESPTTVSLLTADQRFTSPRSMSGQVIMGIAYGIDIAPRDDPYVSLAEKALEAVESASTTGWTFDMLPFCRSLMTLVIMSPVNTSVCRHAPSLVVPWCQFQKGGRNLGATYRRNGQQAVPDCEKCSCALVLFVPGLFFADTHGSGNRHGSAVRCGVHDR